MDPRITFRPPPSQSRTYRVADHRLMFLSDAERKRRFCDFQKWNDQINTDGISIPNEMSRLIA